MLFRLIAPCCASMYRGGSRTASQWVAFQLRASSFTAALSTASRGFIQGGPPPQKEDKAKMRQMMEPDKKEFEERYQARLREVREYYAREEPDKPAPLPENAFVKGQFGMRRRIHRGLKDKSQYDPERLEEAMAEGVNAMRK